MVTLDSRQVRWKCRRGMLELDYLLLNFFDRCYEALPAEQKVLFIDLLNSTDIELYQWLVKEEIIQEPSFKELVKKILSATQDQKS